MKQKEGEIRTLFMDLQFKQGNISNQDIVAFNANLDKIRADIKAEATLNQKPNPS